MSEQDTEIENDRQPQFGADAFAAVLTILAAAADPKATARHCGSWKVPKPQPTQR